MTNAANLWDAKPPKDYDEMPEARAKHEGFGDGLLMHKYPFPGELEVLPQIRPRFPVEMDKRGQWHCHALAYKHKPEHLPKHIDEEHGGFAPQDWEWHAHSDVAKYLICPEPSDTVEHDHATDPAFQGPKGREKLISHLSSRKRPHWVGPKGQREPLRLSKKELRNRSTERLFQLVSGEHAHTYPVHRADKKNGVEHPRRRQHVADRFDIHSWALERLPNADIVFCGLEGTPKADAILTQIIEDALAASVCDVPSVTLWKDPDLKRIAETRFRGRRVVIVPDADHHWNDAVVRQSLRFRERLRDLGVAAFIAAPPIPPDVARSEKDEPQACDCKVELDADRRPKPHISVTRGCTECRGYFKGVDDFLAAGGKLAELAVFDREAGFTLALHSKPDGTIRASTSCLGTLLRCGTKAERVIEVLANHIRAGYLTADRDLEIGEDPYTGHLGWKGKPEEWPVFTIREDHRYVEKAFVPLRNYAPSSFPKTVEQIFLENFFVVWLRDFGGRAFVHPSGEHITEAIRMTEAQTGLGKRALQIKAKPTLDFVHRLQALFIENADSRGRKTAWTAAKMDLKPRAVEKKRAKQKKENQMVVAELERLRNQLAEQRDEQSKRDAEQSSAIERVEKVLHDVAWGVFRMTGDSALAGQLVEQLIRSAQVDE